MDDSRVFKDPIPTLDWKTLHGKTLDMYCTSDAEGYSLIAGVDVVTKTIYVLKEIKEDAQTVHL